MKRTIKSLEKQGLILTVNFIKPKIDKTKWYPIDGDKLEELGADEQIHSASSTDQINMNTNQIGLLEEVIVTQVIPKSTSENTTKNLIPFSEIITDLNDKPNSSYKLGTKKTKELITKRRNKRFLLKNLWIKRLMHL